METRTTCPYCGVGCGVIIEHNASSIVGVRGDADHPANRGQLCTKGRTLHLTATPAAMAGRARHPMMRSAKDAPLVRVEWHPTLDTLADRFADCIRKHGADSVAFYISGQLLTEDYYVFNKLAKGLIGTNNIDTNSRLCMSSAVAGYKATLGADAPPTCYDDIDHARCFFIAGSNAAWTHPVLYRRIEAAKQRDSSIRVIVVDPRKTATAASADLHLAIEPGTDVALFHGLLHLMLREERIDRAFIASHTTGFDALKAIVREFTPSVTSDMCGIDEAALVQAARWFADGPTLSLYCQGLNQSSSGTAKNAALVNLHLATGQIGRIGAGPFSLTGQPNAMGGREVGGMANLLSAHRNLDSEEDRREIAALWGVDQVPARPGLTAVELFDALAEGDVKMVWIACTNPAQSMPDQATVRRALACAELVVLQEAYRGTETEAYADVLLPAASWGEKDGTVTNSERRISRVRAAIAPPGEARADWAIAADFARRLESRLRRGRSTLFPYRHVAEIFAEHATTTRGRDLDIGGLSYARLERDGPQQWPCPDPSAEGRARLYTDHLFATPDRRARFTVSAYAPVAEKIDARFPFRLTTGRLRDQWHAMSRTGTIAALFAHTPEPALEMHPSDATTRGFAAGDLVRVESRRGSVIVPVTMSSELLPGGMHLPMHWGSTALAGCGSAGVNALTAKAFCPTSKQPELKHAAVRVVKAALPWQLVAFGFPRDVEMLAAMRDEARQAAANFDYASVVLIGGARAGLLLRVASRSAPRCERIDAVDRIFDLHARDVGRYDDATRSIGRRMRIVDGKLAAVRLSGDLRGETWLREWLTEQRDVASSSAMLLLPSANPPAGHALRGRIVCTCFNVSEAEIETAVSKIRCSDGRALETLQAQLQCGTNCGTCLPELRRRLVRHRDGSEVAPA